MQQAGDAQPPPAVFFKLGLTGISGDQQYLYVMAGGEILQYEVAGMTLQRSVDLPDIAPPQCAPPKAPDPGKFPPHPPMGGPPHGLWAGNGYLYVLGGPVIWIYSVPDLTLQKTVELPKPQLPQVGK
ncbi:MAG: hypothetical protein ABSG91_23335 [Syntrophobacteraceae bacterium]